MLLSLVRAGEALAAEPFVIAGEPAKVDIEAAHARALPSAPTWGLPTDYRPIPPRDEVDFSPRDFRRRTPPAEADPDASRREDLPMLGSSTVWQRLAEFRGHNRVRLLTLWEAGSSSVSLQTNRKGDPSLQWTSRLMNRGGPTRGLFDQAFSATIAGAGRSMHLGPRAAAEENSAHVSKLLEGGATR